MKSKKIWWILGWIFCFPIPLTILICRSRLKKGIKICLVGVLWFFIVLGLVLDFTGLSKEEHLDFDSMYISSIKKEMTL